MYVWYEWWWEFEPMQDQNSEVTKILCTLKSFKKIFADNRGADQNSVVKKKCVY